MTEEKRNRIVAAVTVNVILLILTRLRAKRQQLLRDMEYYQQQVDENEDFLERLQSEENLRDLLIEYGYHFTD